MRAMVAAMMLLGAARAEASERIAVVVGNNLGLIDELPLRYAERDAARVALALTALAGFEPEQVHELLGGTAWDLRGLLGELAGRDQPPLVMLYYSGHGDGAELHMSGSSLPLEELRGLVDGIGARISVVLVDACESGALTRAKGARLGPAYSIDFLRPPDVEGQIVITSSSADEISQESDLLEGSFFTHYWVTGLYGAADTDGDGMVTLEEAYRFAHFRTVESTIQSSGGVQHPSYQLDLSGQGNVVLANLRAATARIEIAPTDDPGHYFVLDPDKRLVLAELGRASDGAMTIRLPPGEYRVRKREARRVRVLDLGLASGEHRRIEDDDMVSIDYDPQAIKGITVVEEMSHGPQIFGGLRNGLVGEMGITSEVEVGYPILGEVLAVTPRFIFRTAILEASRERHFEYDVGLSLGAHFETGPVTLRPAVDAGFLFFDQQKLPVLSASTGEGDGRGANTAGLVAQSAPGGAFSVSFQGSLVFDVGVPVTEWFTLWARAKAGVAIFDKDEDTLRAFVGGGAVGASVDF